ncbi:uncharacterized protein LY89DRAFT_642613, partial [Mollisia scopiformis]
MKYIFRHSKTLLLLRDWAGTSELCTAGFFFWNSGLSLQCSQNGLFRSLLYEILCKYQELIPAVLPAQWGVRYTSKCQARHCPPESWELSTLQKAFTSLISQTKVDLKLCLFIDGLDEYKGNEDDIAALFGEASTSENVKICYSSRPHLAFVEAFETRPRLRLQDLTFPDIRRYIHDRLETNIRMQQLSQAEPEATKKLIEEIGNAANGVFLWVTLVVTSLLRGLSKHDNIRYLQMRLRGLPEELDNLYHHMVYEVDNIYQQEAAKMFQLVDTNFQTRENRHPSPFREKQDLTVLFLSFASERDTNLAFEAELGFMTFQQVMDRCKDMERRLGTRCGGLLEVQYRHDYDNHDLSYEAGLYVSPNMTITYLHRTVKDFLELPETRRLLADRASGPQTNTFNTIHAFFR